MHMRFIGRAHMEDVASYRKDPHSASWPKLSDDLDQELTASNRRLSLLVERVADHDLRKKIKDIRPEFGRILFTRVSGESRSQFVALTDSFEKVMEELGAVLRSYY